LTGIKEKQEEPGRMFWDGLSPLPLQVLYPITKFINLPRVILKDATFFLPSKYMFTFFCLKLTSVKTTPENVADPDPFKTTRLADFVAD